MDRRSAIRFLVMLLLLSAVMVGDVALMALVAVSLSDALAWSSFVPDLVVGIITTGGLGYLLWSFTRRIEQNAELRAETRAARMQWATLARRLAIIVNTEDFDENLHDASDLGPVADDVIRLLENEPLAEYASLLNHTEITMALSALSALEQVRGLGRAVNSTIASAYSKNSLGRREPLALVQSVLIGSALGLSAKLIAQEYGVPLEDMDAVLERIRKQMPESISVDLGAYALSRVDAQEKVTRLRSKAPAMGDA